jgi:hypothetical protein
MSEAVMHVHISLRQQTAAVPQKSSLSCDQQFAFFQELLVHDAASGQLSQNHQSVGGMLGFRG